MPDLMPNTISFKENSSIENGTNFYRNSDADSGTLSVELLAPTIENGNPDVTVFVDPVSHPITTDILPDPAGTPKAIWIEGERIEYETKTLIAPNTWQLGLISRGTNGTAAAAHALSVAVWIEETNNFSGNNDVWNASNTNPDLLTEAPAGEYTSVSAVPIGGLWYAGTTQALFLKQEQGKSIP
jgi:hypothetical protein